MSVYYDRNGNPLGGMDKYADRQLKAIESELMAMQTISKSVRQAYSAAGVGER